MENVRATLKFAWKTQGQIQKLYGKRKGKFEPYMENARAGLKFIWKM